MGDKNVERGRSRIMKGLESHVKRPGCLSCDNGHQMPTCAKYCTEHLKIQLEMTFYPPLNGLPSHVKIGHIHCKCQPMHATITNKGNEVLPKKRINMSRTVMEKSKKN